MNEHILAITWHIWLVPKGLGSLRQSALIRNKCAMPKCNECVRHSMGHWQVLRAAWKVLKSTLQSNLGQIAMHAKDNSALLGRRSLAGTGSPNAAIVSDAVHPLHLNSIWTASCLAQNQGFHKVSKQTYLWFLFPIQPLREKRNRKEKKHVVLVGSCKCVIAEFQFQRIYLKAHLLAMNGINFFLSLLN